MSQDLIVVLASASPARKDLLIQAGVEPLIINSKLNENEVISNLKNKSAENIVITLATAKANKVVAEHILPKKGVLIAADSMWEFNKEIVGKPFDRLDAKNRILKMSGNSGILHTGHFVLNLETLNSTTAVVSTQVLMDEISEEEIDRYLDTAEPLQVAGSFTLNGYGSAFVKSVSGDSNNVIGLSINTVKNLCKAVGLDWTNYWKLKK